MPVELTVLGSGDAFNSEGRGNACYLLRDALGAACVDFGPTGLMQLKALGADPNDIDTIYLTHLHGDHFGGMHLFLVDAEYSARRQRPLAICGPRGVRAHLEQWFALAFGKAAPDRRFEQQFIEFGPGEVREVHGRRVTALPMAHMQASDLCLGYRFDLPDARIALSGDTAWTEALIELSRDTDLFVCDCTEASGHSPQHLTWEVLAPQVERLQTRHLLLSHLGSSMRRAAPCIEGGRVSLAEDGLCLRIGAPATAPTPGVRVP